MTRQPPNAIVCRLGRTSCYKGVTPSRVVQSQRGCEVPYCSRERCTFDGSALTTGSTHEHHPGGATASGNGLRPGTAALLRHAHLPGASAGLLLRPVSPPPR